MAVAPVELAVRIRPNMERATLMDNGAVDRVSRNRGTDRRTSERVPEFTAGLLAHDDGAAVLNCLIRNIGMGGAQIRANAGSPIPDEAYLLNLKHRCAYRTRTVWRQGSLTGVNFESEYGLNNELPAHLEFLRRLFVAAMLRQVDQLTAQGLSLAEALFKLGLAHETYLRWCDVFAARTTRRVALRN
jgi:hypothetical protein